MIDNTLTIAQLCNVKPFLGPETSLTKRVKDIVFNKAINDFDTEDVRLLISQNDYLEITIPLALGLLKNNPMIEGDFYPGDLLKCTLTISNDYWKSHLSEKGELEQLFIENKNIILNYDVSNEIKEQIRAAFERLLET